MNWEPSSFIYWGERGKGRWNWRVSTPREMEITSSFSSMLPWRQSSCHSPKAAVKLRINTWARGTHLSVSNMWVTLEAMGTIRSCGVRVKSKEWTFRIKPKMLPKLLTWVPDSGQISTHIHQICFYKSAVAEILGLILSLSALNQDARVDIRETPTFSPQ